MFIIVIIEYELHRVSQSHHDFSVSLSLVKDLEKLPTTDCFLNKNNNFLSIIYMLFLWEQSIKFE